MLRFIYISRERVAITLWDYLSMPRPQALGPSDFNVAHYPPIALGTSNR